MGYNLLYSPHNHDYLVSLSSSDLIQEILPVAPLEFMDSLAECFHLLRLEMYSTVQYSTVKYSTVQYSTVQYSTVQYSTIPPGSWVLAPVNPSLLSKTPAAAHTPPVQYSTV